MRRHSLKTLAVTILALMSLSGAPVVAQSEPSEAELEKLSVAFAMMMWLPRIDGVCDLYKAGYLQKHQLQGAYSVMIENFHANEDSKATITTLIDLIHQGPDAMKDYFGADLDTDQDGHPEEVFFSGCPLPAKTLIR